MPPQQACRDAVTSTTQGKRGKMPQCRPGHRARNSDSSTAAVAAGQLAGVGTATAADAAMAVAALASSRSEVYMAWASGAKGGPETDVGG